ncbi:MAG: heat shock protein Hsp20 [Rariglobus sp.]|jgi:HSP20 family molecular chaperone IbpA|nr:heat shock protein Hsp20 [Rariglobus sp.]
MNTIIHPLKPSRSTRSPDATVNTVAARKPHYDCQEQDDGLKVIVYVPGVDAAGVEITTRGPDLLVTARKSHFVRVNFGALNLESVQRDYQLSLRLGRNLDYTALQAEIHEGVLTLTIPKKQPAAFPTPEALSRVA